MPWPGPYDPPPPANQVFTSPDGKRAVWVRGEPRDAYLYDLTRPGSSPVWLDWDVEYVRFYIDDGGNLAQIELRRYDGEHVWFDANGNLGGGAAPFSVRAVALPRHDFAKAIDASTLSAPSFDGR